MNSNEAKIQLNSLIEHFKHGGLDFNATDISAIEILLEENQKYKEATNKAIKFIEKHYYVPVEKDTHLMNKIDQEILLNILKEVEHEKNNN